jgi:hypothetical protein
MILWVILVIASAIVAFTATAAAPLGFFYGVAVYTGFVLFITMFMLVLSLALGKTDKKVLRESSKYAITNIDSLYVYYFHAGKEFRFPRINLDKIVYQDEKLTPLLVINRYNCGGWRKWLLFNLYEDTVESIVYVPEIKDET